MIRPKEVVREISHQYPQVWQQVKLFRAGKGKDLPDWPDWCYIPIAVGVAIATQGDDTKLHQVNFSRLSPAVITAAAAWRITQGVYRFDADLYNALVAQPLDGNIPCDALKRLPEWCVYVETIPDTTQELYIVGFWAHLEKDMNDGREELRFVFFYNDGTLLYLPVHIGNWTLGEGLQRVVAEAEKQANKIGSDLGPGFFGPSDVASCIQLLLYLCADNVDMPRVPRHPSTRVRQSGQVDVVREPRTWDVGVRIGASIRKYRNEEAQGAGRTEQGTRESPRPHIRRAHWHHFWAGPMDGERKLVLRWLPPIPVGVEDEEGPVVIHSVED